MFNQGQMALKTLNGDSFEIIEVRKNKAYQAFPLAICNRKGWDRNVAQFDP